MRGGAPSAAHGSRGEYRGYPAVVRAEDGAEDVVEDLMRELGRMLTFKGGDDAVGRFCCYACDNSRRVRVDIGIVASRVPSPPLRPGHRVAPSRDEVGSVRGTPRPVRVSPLAPRPRDPSFVHQSIFRGKR